MLAAIRAYEELAKTCDNGGTSDGFSYDSFVNAVEAQLKSLGVENPRNTVKQGGVGSEFFETTCRKFYASAGGRCPATVSVIGAIAAQETVKACTHVLTPLTQWLLFESLDSIDLGSASSTQANREAALDDDVVKVYGKEVADELRSLRCLLVGSGAIGCELLKTMALMNVGVGPSASPEDANEAKAAAGSESCGVWKGMEEGGVVVTDMDNIEKSNLSRQLLFR